MFASIFETQTTSGQGQPHNKVQKTRSMSICILKATFMKSQKSWTQAELADPCPQYPYVLQGWTKEKQY